jgi:CRP/FNR family cyclic AMP-dependent transcriptional regulator
MSELDWMNLAGYGASLLVFCAFYMKAMVPLRAIAIASNIAFVVYGLGHQLYPVLILHALLLPLNCLRLLQLRRLRLRVRQASRGDLSLEWLVPLMTRRRLRSSDVLFRMGDPAHSIFLVLSGSVRMAEIDVAFGPGSLLGEIGVFAPDSCRTGTAVCETDVEVGSISDAKVLQLCYQDPSFGLYLMRLVIRRMLVGERRRTARAPGSTGVSVAGPFVVSGSPRSPDRARRAL